MSSSGPALSHHGDLYRYWDAVRRGDAIPARSDIDPLGMVQLLPFLGLIERRPEGYFWRLVGTAIVEHFGRDPTGHQYACDLCRCDDGDV